MGLCCYYLRFVKVFAEITSLLYAMTKKGKAFRWFDKCQEAFEKLKDALTEAPVLVMPNEERKFVLEGLTGGHMGRGRTEAQDWGTSEESRIMAQLVDDVQIFAGACSPCAQCYRGPPPRQAHNARWRKVRACINRHHWRDKPTMPVGERFARVSIDIIGPFPTSSKWNNFFLTVMDHFTKWTEAIPLRNRTEPTVAHTLLRHVFNQLGMPL